MKSALILPAIMLCVLLPAGCGGEARHQESGPVPQTADPQPDSGPAPDPEALEDRCHGSRDGAACTALGNYHLERMDHEHAHEFWQKGCDFGDGDGCARRGEAVLKGHGVRRNPSIAADLFISGCDRQRRHALSCFNAGQMLERGQGIKKNYVMAGKYYGTGCNLDLPQSCTALGSMFERGRGLRQNHANAARLYAKACSLDHGPACNSLGMMYDKGRGLDRNEDSAKEFFGRACDLGEQRGCSSYKRINETQLKRSQGHDDRSGGT